MFKAEFLSNSLHTETSGHPEFKRIWTDSRTVQEGDLFAAIPGEKFDGHQFIAEAARRGARGALISQADFAGKSSLPSSFALLTVPDTTEALRKIAAAHRKRLKAQIFAVAGSNGKTTTKEWIGFLLTQLASADDVYKTSKSNNSILGIALSLLQIRDQKFAVIEIGIDEPDWMEKHLQVVDPDAGVITTIGQEHLNRLKTIEKVAEEELKLLQHLQKKKGRFAANFDCPWIEQSSLPPHSLSYALEKKADIEGRYLRPQSLHAFGLEWSSPLPGQHNALNLLAALTSIRLLFPDLENEQMKMLKFCTPLFKGEAHRGIWLACERGIRIFDDCYNANPDSMEMALEAFRDLADGCRQILILGDMLDLGESTEKAHLRILNLALVSGAEEIILLGPSFKKALQMTTVAGSSPSIHSFLEMNELKIHLATILQPHDCLFLKGSRGMALERVLEEFKSC